MNTTLWFWIGWVIELVAFLIISGDLWWRYSQRALTPIAPDQWNASRRYLAMLLVLLTGSLVLRYMGYPQWAFYLVISPVALLLVFFIVAAVGIMFGARTN